MVTLTGAVAVTLPPANAAVGMAESASAFAAAIARIAVRNLIARKIETKALDRVSTYIWCLVLF
jgi:hypothetical protein